MSTYTTASFRNYWINNSNKSGLVLVRKASFLHNNAMRLHRHLVAYDGPVDTGDEVLPGRHGGQLRFIHMLQIGFSLYSVVDNGSQAGNIPTDHRDCADHGHMIIVVSIVVNNMMYDRGRNYHGRRVDKLHVVMLVSPQSRPV